MNEQQPNQISVLAARLVEFQRFFAAMPVGDRQFVIQHTEMAIDLFRVAVRNRTGRPEDKLFVREGREILIPPLPAFRAETSFVSVPEGMQVRTLGPSFTKHFLNKVEDPVDWCELAVIRPFQQSVSGMAVAAALGGVERVKITLGQFFFAFAQQSGKGHELLQRQGYEIFAYILDDDDAVWQVSGLWDDGGWGFNAIPFAELNSMRNFNQILVPAWLKIC